MKGCYQREHYGHAGLLPYLCYIEVYRLFSLFHSAFYCLSCEFIFCFLYFCIFILILSCSFLSFLFFKILFNLHCFILVCLRYLILSDLIFLILYFSIFLLFHCLKDLIIINYWCLLDLNNFMDWN